MGFVDDEEESFSLPADGMLYSFPDGMLSAVFIFRQIAIDTQLLSI